VHERVLDVPGAYAAIRLTAAETGNKAFWWAVTAHILCVVIDVARRSYSGLAHIESRSSLRMTARAFERNPLQMTLISVPRSRRAIGLLDAKAFCALSIFLNTTSDKYNF
jgi:hypothetical protein